MTRVVRPPVEVHSFGDAAQDAADTATAQAQHAAAIAAYNARQAGDLAGYQAAIQQLYTLGIQNAGDASQQDLLNIAASAGGVSTLATVEHLATLGLVLFGAYVALQLVRSLTAGRRRP